MINNFLADVYLPGSTAPVLPMFFRPCASDSILKCFTPNLIDSRHMNVVNFAGVSEIATNEYRHEFMTVDGSRFAAIDSFDNQYFSLSTDWTQRVLDQILHQFRVPDWGRERVTNPMGRTRVYMLLGTNHNEVMAKKVAWSEIGGYPHFGSPNLPVMKSIL